jgi:hypothetical protein
VAAGSLTASALPMIVLRQTVPTVCSIPLWPRWPVASMGVGFAAWRGLVHAPVPKPCSDPVLAIGIDKLTDSQKASVRPPVGTFCRVLHAACCTVCRGGGCLAHNLRMLYYVVLPSVVLMCCSVAALAPALAVALGRPFRFSEPNPFCFRGSAMKARTAHAQPPWAASW